MKLSILLLAFLNLICIVIASADLDRCNAQCSVLKNCNLLYSENPKKAMDNIPIWPPSLSKKPKVSQCYCDKINEYEACLKCYYQPNPNKIPQRSEFETECKVLNTKLGGDKKEPNPLDNKTTPAANQTTIAATTTIGITNTPPVGTTQNNNSNPTTNTTKLEGIKDDKESKNTKNNNKSSSSKYVLYAVIGCVVLGGIIGFVVYNNKKKSRPESMPFYGNTVSSPNQYTTLDVPKSNTTLNYNTNRGATDSYYQQNTYNNYNFSTDNQFPPYQTMDYQYDNKPNPTIASPHYENNNTIGVMPTYDVVNNNNIASLQNENSLNYDNRRESMNQSMSMDQSLSQNIAPASISNNITYTCSYPYEPKLDDELELRINDKVKILEEFEDGWMKALNITSGKEGMAPIVCVKETH